MADIDLDGMKARAEAAAALADSDGWIAKDASPVKDLAALAADVLALVAALQGANAQMARLRAEVEYAKPQYERGYADAKRRMLGGLRAVEETLREGVDADAAALDPEARARYALAVKLMAEQVEAMQP